MSHTRDLARSTLRRAVCFSVGYRRILLKARHFLKGAPVVRVSSTIPAAQAAPFLSGSAHPALPSHVRIGDAISEGGKADPDNQGEHAMVATAIDTRASLKATCPRKALFEAVQTVGHAVSGRNPLPILSHILVQAEESSLRLIATDLELGISCR